MAMPLNQKAEQFQIALEYLKAEQERRRIREAILNVHRKHTLKLVVSR